MHANRTLALIKPDAVRRGLVGPIMSRMSTLFEFADVKMFHIGTWDARAFYGRQHIDKPYFEELLRVMNAGPMIAVMLKGVPHTTESETFDVIAQWRRMLLSLRTVHATPNAHPAENLVHGSDSPESLRHEATVLHWYPHLWL